MEKYRLVSLMRPTGKLHLGHYIGVLENWIKLQNQYQCFYGIADLHALTTKYDKTENLKDDIINVALDWLSCGIDPEKSTIYVQSKLEQISQLHVLFSMITPQNWVLRDPTLKDMAKILNNKDSNTNDITYGLLGYPVLMTVDIAIFNASFVPVGVDQVAHIEISRDIIRRFNNIYKTNFFVEPKPLLTQTPLLLGLDGKKMGKSFNNDIKISDDEKTTQEKIMKAISDSNRIRKDDQGNPENCQVVFKYYQAFCDDKELLEQISCECKCAAIGCVQCKKRLSQIINDKFRTIREKRAKIAQDKDYIFDLLAEGSKKADLFAQQTLDKANEIMKMFY